MGKIAARRASFVVSIPTDEQRKRRKKRATLPCAGNGRARIKPLWQRASSTPQHTHHIRVRMAERGYGWKDIEYVHKYGARGAGEKILLTRKAIEDFKRTAESGTQEGKLILRRLKRLRGTTLVCTSGRWFITVYRARRARRER